MKKQLLFASLCVGALLLSGCADDDARRKAEAQEKKAEEAYNNDFAAVKQSFADAQAKENANQLQSAQQMYELTASMAEARASQPGGQKMKFMSYQQQSKAASQRLKDQMALNEKVAIAEAEKKKKDEELKKKADAAAATAAEATKPATNLATGATPVGDAAAPATPAAPGTKPAAGGGEDDDPIAAAKPGTAPAAGAGVKPSDIYKGDDEKTPFKCFKVVSQKKYVIAYVILRNTYDKEKKVVRFNADFASAKGEDHWPVVAFYQMEDFKTNNWNDLDADNPKSIGPERLVLQPGHDTKLVLISNMADRDGEYAKAVKLTGSVIWSDNSETNVINSN